MDYRYDFGAVTAITAEAIGQPGNRTFRLLLRNEGASACLWLEKEQLQALALAGHELLAQVGGESEAAEQVAITGSKPGRADIEFKVSQLGLGYDPAGTVFMLIAHEADADPEGPPMLRCLLTRSQLGALAQQAQEVCASGRPRCVLCGQPLEPAPHLCPPSNGHGVLATE